MPIWISIPINTPIRPATLIRFAYSDSALDDEARGPVVRERSRHRLREPVPEVGTSSTGARSSRSGSPLSAQPSPPPLPRPASALRPKKKLHTARLVGAPCGPRLSHAGRTGVVLTPPTRTACEPALSDLPIAVQQGRTVGQFDVSNAFQQGIFLAGEITYVRMPAISGGGVRKRLALLYGLKQ